MKHLCSSHTKKAYAEKMLLGHSLLPLASGPQADNYPSQLPLAEMSQDPQFGYSLFLFPLIRGMKSYQK